MSTSIKPLVLVILDGWGYNPNDEHNAIAKAHTPNWDNWWQNYCHGLLGCSGTAVGLPSGQMGNSEVGHMHIGAGRVINQDFSRINKEIDTDNFKNNQYLKEISDHARKHDKNIHILGLLSDGGVHSHQNHIQALLESMQREDVGSRCYVHAFLDGRDTPPKSAEKSLCFIEQALAKSGGHLASLCGRYYAMDRDSRWQRTQKCYDMLSGESKQQTTSTALGALQKSYAENINDEFVEPTQLSEFQPICAGDVVVFMNFRADRARQLSRALSEENFKEFARKKWGPLGRFVTLTQYSEQLQADVAFPPEFLQNTFGDVVAKKGMTQLRIAETEKYPHVTFFLNGGKEQEFEGEKRIMIPSPKVKTYDIAPCMSARELTTTMMHQIDDERFDVIICNYANADMVGHTGNFDATISAIECLDECLGELYSCVQKKGGELFISADHGNAETMFDASHQQAHTAHTCGPVPFLYLGRHAIANNMSGSLIDIAPTLLYLLNIEIPKEMQGKPLVSITP